MNKEIEIKIKLSENLDFGLLQAKLNTLTKNEYIIEYQNDLYYDTSARRFSQDINNIDTWFRIREYSKKIHNEIDIDNSLCEPYNYYLTLKKWLPENDSIKSYSNEYEIKVINQPIEDMKTILKYLGYEELIKVQKERKKWLIRNEYEISIDSVKDLGNFMEIEYKGNNKNDNDIEYIKKEMYNFLKFLGIEKYDIDIKGYPYLLLDRIKDVSKDKEL
jgi:predicted adenylyl cyclase CyaB